MTVEEVFTALRSLDRPDKVRAMQVLVMELASDEQVYFLPGAHYEVWSPTNASDAVQTLEDLLANDQNEPVQPTT